MQNIIILFPYRLSQKKSCEWFNSGMSLKRQGNLFEMSFYFPAIFRNYPSNCRFMPRKFPGRMPNLQEQIIFN
jgi:hypothetical protein